MLQSHLPALILAPMDGITDAPMRALQGRRGAFSFAVSEFLRVSTHAIPLHVFRRDVPELCTDGVTPTGLPVVVQILGGHAGRMAETAHNAYLAGARAIDINFGCPAPTVNKHDGGATLLNHPCRIREIVSTIRNAVPSDASVSAKVRLGWDSIDAVHQNAVMAAEGGASWLTVHARTRMQGYAPPVYWKTIGVVREALDIPVVANGDIWTVNDFRQCREETGCAHFMIGRGALANPALSHQIAKELGISAQSAPTADWALLLRELLTWTEHFDLKVGPRGVQRLKQWLNLAQKFGEFKGFEVLKRIETVDEFLDQLQSQLDQAA